MIEKLKQYVDSIFASYESIKSVAELKTDLIADLQEKFSELKDEGKDDETAFEMTIDSIGDIEQTVMEAAGISRALERQLLINFNASNLEKSDFAGVRAQKGKFAASVLCGSNFSGADLSGSSFKVSDLTDVIFDKANLTDCSFYVSDLRRASFNNTILVRTNFNTSDLNRAKFINTKLIDVNLILSDLRKAIFENCIFEGVNFKTSDLTGLCLDGQSFMSVKVRRSGAKRCDLSGCCDEKCLLYTPVVSYQEILPCHQKHLF